MKTTYYKLAGEYVGSITAVGAGNFEILASGVDMPYRTILPSEEAAQKALSQLFGGATLEKVSDEELQRFIKANEASFASEEHKKRKTTTSTAVKARYNKKHYTRVPLDVPKELAEQFKKKCAAEGTSCSAVLKAAIEVFLKN